MNLTSGRIAAIRQEAQSLSTIGKMIDELLTECAALREQIEEVREWYDHHAPKTGQEGSVYEPNMDELAAILAKKASE